MKFKLVVAFVDPDISEEVVSVAKKAGATGNAIMRAKGSGIEAASFWGLSIQDKTDIILFVVEEHHVPKLMEAVSKACKLEEPGNGILITLSIDRVAGLSKQIAKIRENLADEEL